MMWGMIPRLWEYQVELPARTVIHATAAIILGVLLFTKLAILRWFRHFEESMPSLGFGTLVCTIVIGVLSIPFALRAQGIGVGAFTEENLERVDKLMARIEFEDGVDSSLLTTEEGLARGRRILVGDCVRCHDMRTILAKPHTAEGWYKVVMRMTEKPSVFGEPTRREDVPYVTAYLAAITPEIQESRQLEKEQQERRSGQLANLFNKLTSVATPGAQTPETPDGESAQEPEAEPEAPAKAPKIVREAEVDTSSGPALLQKYCTDCHEPDEIEDHGGGDLATWTQVMADMIEEGMEIPEDDAKTVIHFLTEKYPKSKT
jgi:mono/diheme cytochrome c family protein